MINSLSIEDLFWGQIDEGRISFRHKDMPDSVHFTISWTNPNNINFHITKNIGDGMDKPQIKIAWWNQDLVDKFIPHIPALIIGKMYAPLSFKRYSRRSRKNIRIVYFDEIESHSSFKTLESDANSILKQHSSMKRKKLSIKMAIEKDFMPFASSAPMRALFLNNLRPLTVNSFVSKFSRCGIIFIGNRKFHFFTYYDKCFILKKRTTIHELLKFIMTPELVDALMVKINKALVQIQNTKTFADTIPHNNPYQLFIEKEN